MSKQTIQLGTAPTGVGGDTPRSAFTKAQSNFDELYAALGASGSPIALPAALPVAQGGTGGTTQAAARTALGLGLAAVAPIVGTVSWAGGVPTGAIIESGSSANGQYTKLADGTMFCWLLMTGLSIAMTSGYGGGIIGTQNWAYPVGFASTPVVFMGARGAGKFTTTSPADATSATLGSFLVFDPAGGAYTGSFNCFFLAVGRWK